VTQPGVLAGERDAGIGMENAAARRANPSARRILGAGPGLGASLGLSGDWAFRVLSQAGNYGEVGERNLGQGSLLGVPRGLNAL
jgi:general L-amino acid transport system substrate-binding protein